VPTTVIVCTKCRKSNQIRATFICNSTICGGTTWTEGPKPAGVPVSQPCPGPGPNDCICGQVTPYSSYVCLRCVPQL